ncbi:MAG TPA: helix-turn-helix transcriptional regulator [Chloroflexia bacterium]|nr:helix-turn-helix transcriptional regulator [Chloroflexia bacterium]
MTGRLSQSRHAQLSTETADEGVQDLVQQIVSQVASHEDRSAVSSAGSDEQEILLDIEVDGSRYRLLRSQPRPSGPAISLSPREQEIARMVAKGYPNKTIADVLDISSWTVCTYLRRIFAKLGVSSRAAMVARLMEEQYNPTESAPRRHD